MKITKYGYKRCNLCELYTRVSDIEDICIPDSNINARLDILLVFSGLLRGTHKNMLSTQGAQEIYRLVKLQYPNKSVGITSVTKCGCSPEYVKHSVANKCFSHYFNELLLRTRPKVIVSLGALSTKMLTKKTGITRGKLVKTQYGNVMPTYKAESILFGDISEKEGFITHIKSIFNDGKKKLLSKFNIFIPKSKSDLHKAYNILKKSSILAVDIETSAFTYTYSRVGHKLLSISFSSDDKSAIVFGLDLLQSIYKNPDDKELAYKIVKSILESNIPKIFHNGKFDVSFIEYHTNIKVTNFSDDTMVMCFMYNSLLEKGLKAQIGMINPELRGYDDILDEYKRNNPIANPDRDGSYYYIPNDILLPYNGLDTIATMQIYNYYLPKIKQLTQLYNTYKKVMMPALRCYIDLEKRGVYVDIDAVITQSKKNRQTLNKLLLEIHQYLSDNSIMERNINSPEQVAKILLKLNLITKEECKYSSKLKKYTVGDEVVTNLVNKGVKIAKLINGYKKLRKQTTTYLDNMQKLADKNNRIHPSFSMLAITYRSMCSSPNLQNIPYPIRTYYKAEPDYYRMQFDWSQLELRLMATISNDPTMLYMYNHDKDLHSLTAAGSKIPVDPTFLNKCIETHDLETLYTSIMTPYLKLDKKVTKLLRQYAKNTNFHCIYGGSSGTLIDRINLNIDRTVKELLLEAGLHPEKQEELLNAAEDVKQSRIKITCTNCDFYTDTEKDLISKYKDNVRTSYCPVCKSPVHNPAQELREGFFRLYSNIPNYHERIRQEVEDTGKVTNVFGLYRLFPKGKYPLNKQLSSKEQSAINNAAYNFPIQSVGALLKYQAFIQATKLFKKYNLKSYIDNDVHDALYVSAHKSEVRIVYKIMKYSMEKWSDIYDWCKCPLKADLKIGFDWKNMEEISDLNHLLEWLENNPAQK